MNACKRFQTQWYDFCYFGKLLDEERWSQPRVRLHYFHLIRNIRYSVWISRRRCYCKRTSLAKQDQTGTSIYVGRVANTIQLLWILNTIDLRTKPKFIYFSGTHELSLFIKGKNQIKNILNLNCQYWLSKIPESISPEKLLLWNAGSCNRVFTVYCIKAHERCQRCAVWTCPKTTP